MPLEIVGDFRLKCVSFLDPAVEKIVQLFQFDEQVLGRANLGRRTGKRAFRINQFGRRISGSTTAAIVARLINRLANWAGSTDKAIRQKGTLLYVEQLLDVFFFDEPRLANRFPDLVAI